MYTPVRFGISGDKIYMLFLGFNLLAFPGRMIVEGAFPRTKRERKRLGLDSARSKQVCHSQM